jgi:hypothetical protein
LKEDLLNSVDILDISSDLLKLEGVEAKSAEERSPVEEAGATAD